jgi:hypothetical protein
MKSDWKAILPADPKNIAGGGLISADGGAAATLNGAAMSPLSEHTVVAIAGKDAAEFLHAQFTTEIANCDHPGHRFSAYCSPAGRVLATLHVVPIADGFLLHVPNAIAQSLVSRLRMHVLRADVTIDTGNDKWLSLGLSAGNLSGLIEPVLGSSPDAIGCVLSQPPQYGLYIRGPQPRMIVVAPAECMIELWATLQTEFQAIDSEAWRWLDIAAGVPHLDAATTDRFTAQGLNLDLIDAIDFSKGCYPGQEIIARVHYRGRVKRRLFRLRVDTDRIPSPGDLVYDAKRPDQTGGYVLNAARAPDGGTELLAVLRIADWRDGNLRLVAITGPVLEPLSLPYLIPEVADSTT